MLKRSFLSILLLFCLILSTPAAYAVLYPAPKNMVNHNDSFLISRNITVTGKKTDPAPIGMFTRLLRDNGATFGSGAGPKGKVIIRKVQRIDDAQGGDALRIVVAMNKITVDYTSEQSLKRSVEILKSLIETRGERNFINGANIVDWDGIQSERGEGPIDAVSKLLGPATLENQIKRSPGVRRHEPVYIRFIDKNNWRVETKSFDVINPKVKIYPSDGYYTHQQIRSVLETANRDRIELIPMVELLVENKRFEEVTGHSIFSVEGMRFVRAIIEEYAKEWKCKKICVGKSSAGVDPRYLEFIRAAVARAGMECVILN